MVTIDLGEDNDLHPQNKKDLGKRLALLAAARYGIPVESRGPEVTQVIMDVEETFNQRIIRLICDHAEGMYAASEEKGSEILDFEAVNDKGEALPAAAQITGTEIVLTLPCEKAKIEEIRYCYRTSNRGALIYNRDHLPMSPFVRKLYEDTV